MATAANAAMSQWTTITIPALRDLGAVLQDTLSVIESVFKIVANLTSDNMANVTGSDFVTWSGGGYSVIQQRLIWLLIVAQQLATAARDAMNGVTVQAVPALVDLGAVLANALDVAQSTLGMVGLLTGDKYPDLSAGPLTMIKTRLSQLIKAGQELAVEANAAMGTWGLDVAAGWTKLKSVLSDSLSIVRDTLDLTALLGGEKFPDLSDAVMSILKTRLGQLIKAGQELAVEANTAMGAWSLDVAPGFTTLKNVLSDSLSIAKDALDLVGTLGGEKFPACARR